MPTAADITTSALRAAVATISAASALILLVVGLLPHTGLYRTMTVLSGSMKPTFSPGDLVVTARKPIAQVKLGDVVVYSIPVGDHHVESHRIVQILARSPELVVRTKGDANTATDPWTAKLDGSSIWTVRTTVPYVGYAVLWLRTPLVHKLTVFVTPALVSLLLLRAIWRRRDDGVPDADAVHET